MKKEEKIFLEKEDSLEDIKKVIESSKGERIILNIPKNSVLSNSVKNFREIKKVSEENNKEILIESIDEKALDLAALVGITSYNPIFRKKETIIADIIPQSELKTKAKEETKKVEKKRKVKFYEEEENEEEEEEKNIEKEIFWEDNEKEEEENTLESILDEDYDSKKVNIRHFKEKRTKIFGSRKKILVGGGILFVVLLIFGVFTFILPKLSITLFLKESKIDFDTEVKILTKAESDILGFSKNTTSSFTIPGEIIFTNGNLSLHFDGEGEEKEVKSKATGTLTVYNYYSPNTQILVANTRFVSPEGKIFRAINKVVIPGFTKDKAGNILPGKVDIAVIADEAGEDYNVGPSANWKIPGLKGLPQYEKIYAENKGFMKGGFVGKKFVPTGDFLDKAVTNVKEELRKNLENQLAVLNSKKFKVIPDLTSFEITKEDAKSEEKGGVNVFIAGTLKEFVFDEKYFQKKLIDFYIADKNLEWDVKEFDVKYSFKNVDFEKGEATLNAIGSIVFKPKIDVETLKKELAGKDSDSLRKEISLINGLESADISFWPFWVSKAPYNVSNIKIFVK